MLLGQLGISACRSKKQDPHLSPYTKINSTWIKDLNLLPEPWPHYRKTGCTLQDVDIGKDFSEKSPKAQSQNKQMRPYQFKKEMTNKVKKQSTEREKIFTSHDSGLISWIYNEKVLSKEQIQIISRHMKICSGSLAIREIQIKTTLRFHPTSVRLAYNQNLTNITCWHGKGWKVAISTFGGSTS